MFQNFEVTADKAATPGRLAALRAQMVEANVTGFLVPRADAHQGENVAPHDERLLWLTGFTGSAGSAVVMHQRAAVFVDGRYTLQAADQVMSDHFEIVPVHKTPVAEWLSDVLNDGDRLAYDPWLHGKDEIDKLQQVADEAGAELVSVGTNLIDEIWDDQPPEPAGSVRVHRLAGEESAAKRKRLGQRVADLGASSVVLSLPDSIAWLLNVRGSDIARSPVAHGFAVLHGSGQVDLVMEPDKLGGEILVHLGNDVTVHAKHQLQALISDLEGPVLLDRASAPLWFAETLGQAGCDVKWGRDPCILAKAQKNDTELDGMRTAHLRDGAAMATFLCGLDKAFAAGIELTEIDVVKRLEACRRQGGDLEDISFDTIAGAGPNGAIVHYRVNRETNRKIVPGDILLIDSGGQYPDGTTDVTRTIATGTVTADQRTHFTLVLKGMIGISRLRWPAGLTGRDVDPMARAALWRAGLDYDHGTGHGVGACLNVHEGPASISRRGTEPLLPGMILSNEPGFYATGSHGIRIENLVIVQPPTIPEGGDREMLGFETLTWCPIDRRLIDSELLEGPEVAWLDAYHAGVLERIGPFLDGEELLWLEAACAPLGSEAAPPAQEPEGPVFTVSPVAGIVVVRAGGAVIAESERAVLMQERRHDPVYYLPRDDVGMEFLEQSEKVTRCPHKGSATHFHIIRKSTPIKNGAWSYENPISAARQIAGYVAFYPDTATIEVL